jgi:CheY-like chemotaxis protein
MSKSILIVDYNQTVRTVTRRFLECQPVSKFVPKQWTEAPEKARHLNSDLIILDLAMPRMNDFEAARELRFLSRVPVILFTISAPSIREEEATAAGVNVVVSKPDISSLERQQVALGCCLL